MGPPGNKCTMLQTLQSKARENIAKNIPDSSCGGINCNMEGVWNLGFWIICIFISSLIFLFIIYFSIFLFAINLSIYLSIIHFIYSFAYDSWISHPYLSTIYPSIYFPIINLSIYLYIYYSYISYSIFISFWHGIIIQSVYFSVKVFYGIIFGTWILVSDCVRVRI